METPLPICPQCGGPWDRRWASCPGCRTLGLEDDVTRLLVLPRSGTSPATATTAPRILFMVGGAMLAAVAGFALATTLTVRSIPEPLPETASVLPAAPAVVSATGGLSEDRSDPPRVTLRSYEPAPAANATPPQDVGLPPPNLQIGLSGSPPQSSPRMQRPFPRRGSGGAMRRPGASVQYQPPLVPGPEPRAIPQEGEGLLVLRNRSGFPLTVTLVGPTTESLRLAAASTLPVSLPEGAYRLIAGGEAGEAAMELRLEAGREQALEIEEVLRGDQRSLEVLEPVRP